jgi:hypothetical protein
MAGQGAQRPTLLGAQRTARLRRVNTGMLPLMCMREDALQGLQALIDDKHLSDHGVRAFPFTSVRQKI